MIITKAESNDCHIDKAFKWSHKYFKDKKENNKIIAKQTVVVLTNVDMEIQEPVAYIVALYFKITKEELLSKSRKAEFVLPRQIFSYIIRNNFFAIGSSKDNKYQISKIAKYLNAHHTTVIHSLKTINNFREKNILKVNNKIDFILQKMQEDERIKKNKK